MAPNKRAENKKLLNLWLDKDLYSRFAAAAEHFGVSMTAVLTAYITEKVDEYETKRTNHTKQGGNRKTTGDCK